MFLDVQIAVDEAVDAIEAAGGVVKWEGAPPPRSKLLRIPGAEIDDNDAANALPSHWFEPDEDLADGDPRDIRDFVAACLAGDRVTAEALIPRLFGSAVGEAAAAQALRPIRRAA